MPAILETSQPAISSDNWFEDATNAAQASADEEVVVDISSLVRVHSADLDRMIRMHLSLKHEGRRLVFKHAQHQVHQTFTITRLDRLIEMRDPQSPDA